MNPGLPVTLLLAALAVAAPAAAHESRRSGDHDLEVGWLEEPTFVGFPNAVFLEIGHGDEPAGGEFEVEVIFGEQSSATRTEPLPLEPIFGSSGQYQAPLIPTRAGTYTFHIVGTLEDGDEIDEIFTSGEGTFDDPRDPAALQFPAQDPTAGELAERLERIDSRIASLQGSGDQASGGSQLLAIVGLVLGALALIGVVTLRLKRREESDQR